MAKRRTTNKTPDKRSKSYAAHKERAAARQRSQSVTARNIGIIPPCKNPAARKACSRNFRLFCERYFSKTFNLEWSKDHLRVIAKIEAAVLDGGMFGMAMPRGSGKTSLCESAATWATLYGHRSFVFVVAHDEGLASDMVDAVKMHLQVNDLLMGDFPEVCVPVSKLGGIAHRAAGQLAGKGDGELTRIGWTDKEIVYPSVRDERGEWGKPGSFYPACGAVFRTAGITGRIRGAKYVRSDGQTARPDLVLIDDPQSDESARSASQCEEREKIIKGAVIGLAGPGKKIAALAAVTIIRPDDLSARILDREKNPHWQSELTKTLYAMPSSTVLWEEYKKLLEADLPDRERHTNATAYYVENREKMDVGAIVAWPANFTPPFEVSGLQRAMNLKILDERMFAAEYQNEPLPDDFGQDDRLTVDIVLSKINGYKRGIIPISCETMTMFVDVQANVLYYLVCAWEREFSGFIVDYGTFPEQRAPYFLARDATPTLKEMFPRAGTEGGIRAGLESITGTMLSRKWPRADGALVAIDRCLIDMGYATEVIKQFWIENPFRNMIGLSKGKGIRASDASMEQAKRKPGERYGLNWYIPLSKGNPVRHVEYDTNYWKSFVRRRFHTAIGDAGSLSVFKSSEHRLFADHMTSEFSTRTAGRGREIDEWKIRPERPDNHWWDCIVGAHVAASMEGIGLKPTGPAEHRVKRRMVDFAEWQMEAQANQ